MSAGAKIKTIPVNFPVSPAVGLLLCAALSCPAGVTVMGNVSPGATSWPGTTLTTPGYTRQKKNLLSDPDWTTVATLIPSGGFSPTNVDNSAAGARAFYCVTGPDDEFLSALKNMN